MTNQHTDECAYGLHNTGADGFCKKCGLGTNTDQMRAFKEECPERIYLIDMGEDMPVWCDDPSPDNDERFYVEYVRADATASAEAKYLPVIEKLVEAINYALDQEIIYTGCIEEPIRTCGIGMVKPVLQKCLHALALAAPLLKGEK